MIANLAMAASGLQSRLENCAYPHQSRIAQWPTSSRSRHGATRFFLWMIRFDDARNSEKARKSAAVRQNDSIPDREKYVFVHGAGPRQPGVQVVKYPSSINTTYPYQVVITTVQRHYVADMSRQWIGPTWHCSICVCYVVLFQVTKRFEKKLQSPIANAD